MPNEAVFLSPRETAACLGVTRQTVHNLMNQREIPSVLLGGNRLIPRSFIDDLVAKAMATVESADTASRRARGEEYHPAFGWSKPAI